ncbi:MAG: hypothetical protein AAF349_01075 [Cyanobacteria bacterium P01_A01_bin.68]
MFGNKIKITDFLLIQIAKYKFFHGPFQVDGRISGVIYFKDINIGLLAVSADNTPTGMVKFRVFLKLLGYRNIRALVLIKIGIKYIYCL